MNIVLIFAIFLLICVFDFTFGGVVLSVKKDIMEGTPTYSSTVFHNTDDMMPTVRNKTDLELLSTRNSKSSYILADGCSAGKGLCGTRCCDFNYFGCCSDPYVCCLGGSGGGSSGGSSCGTGYTNCCGGYYCDNPGSTCVGSGSNAYCSTRNPTKQPTRSPVSGSSGGSSCGTGYTDCCSGYYCSYPGSTCVGSGSNAYCSSSGTGSTRNPTKQPTRRPYDSDDFYQMAPSAGAGNQYLNDDDITSVLWNAGKKFVTQQVQQKLLDYGEKALINSIKSQAGKVVAKTVISTATKGIVTTAITAFVPPPYKFAVRIGLSVVSTIFSSSFFRRVLTDDSSHAVGIGLTYNLTIDFTDLPLSPEQLMTIANEALATSMTNGKFMEAVRATALQLNSTSFKEAQPLKYEVIGAIQVYDYTSIPTVTPTRMPTVPPTTLPSKAPTSRPSTVLPSTKPTGAPSSGPTTSPAPSPAPTFAPSDVPTARPTQVPSNAPSASPSSSAPSCDPTAPPTVTPTFAPSNVPTASPTHVPSSAPSVLPSSSAPSCDPTAPPTVAPSNVPTARPTQVLSNAPSASPSSSAPSCDPTVPPTVAPTFAPPTASPTQVPSNAPSALPSSSAPSCDPTAPPTVAPSDAPTARPTQVPSIAPTVEPTPILSPKPTSSPTYLPSAAPSLNPHEMGGIVVLDALFDLRNCSSAALDPDSQEVIVLSVVALTGLERDTVTFAPLQAVISLTLRNKHTASTVNTTGDVFNISARISATLYTEKFPSFARDTHGLANFFSCQLTQYVKSGAFSTALRSVATSHNATSLTFAVVNAVQVTTLVTIFEAQPTPTPSGGNGTSSNELGTAAVVGISFLVVVVVALLLFYACRVFKVRQSKVIAIEMP